MLEQIIHKNPQLQGTRITPDTKVIRVLEGYIKCADKQSASFNISYLDSLIISDTSTFWAYNISDNKEYRVITYYNPELSGSFLFPEMSLTLNDIAKFYDLDHITLLSLVGVGYCFIHDAQIWVIEGNVRTDLSTYFEQNYSLKDFRSDVLMRIASATDISFRKSK